MAMQTTPELYPLAGNPALIELFRASRRAGATFEHLRDVHAKKACDQLSPEDLERLEELSRPVTT